MVNIGQYFTTLELTQRLDLLFHLIENTEIIPLIRGPEGIGKSTLAVRVCQSAPNNWSHSLFVADPALVPDRLLANIARCFGCLGQHGEVIDGLVKCFESRRAQGQVPVLLIDDAHLLPASALIALLRLFERQYEGDPLISIVLFADEQIDLLLTTPQLRIMAPQAIQIIDLPSLNRVDATRYMQFLLQKEGIAEDMAMDDAKLTRLYRSTKGIPGPLGQSILDVLGEKKKMEAGYPRQKPVAMLLGMLGLIVLGMVLLFQDRVNQFFLSPQSEQAKWSTTPPVEQAPDLPELIEPSNLAVEANDDITVGELAAGVPLQWDSELESEQANSVIGVIQPVFQDPGTDEVESLVDVHESTLNQGLVASVQADDQQLSAGTTEKTGAQMIGSPILPVSTATMSESEASSPSHEDSAHTRASAVSLPTTPVKPPAGDSLEKTDWIRTQPANHYTLQLLGVERLQSLKDFVARHGLEDQAFYYSTRRKGNPWYPLLWGDFPDKKSAIKASEKLPIELQRQGYWLRQFRELQAQLN